MPFHFSLQPILKLRKSYERLERLRLLGLVAVMVRVREEMAALEQESADARRRLQQTLGSGLAGVELQLEASYEKLRADRKQALEARLADLSQKHESSGSSISTPARSAKSSKISAIANGKSTTASRIAGNSSRSTKCIYSTVPE